MRIGIMLRHIDQHEGGVKVYTRELIDAMIEVNREHELVLLFRSRRRLGTRRRSDSVREVLLEGGPILYWDQVKVPRAVRELGIDVLFNPKYSVPLRASCPTAWVCHGLDWYVMPEASRRLDRLNHRFMIPRYAAKSDAIFAVSETTRAHLIEYLGVPAERIHTVYSGLSDAFTSRPSGETLDEVRKRLNLPPRFLLYSGAVYPPKNFTRLVRAYALVGPPRGVPLVIAGGTNRFLSAHELLEPRRLDIEQWVHPVGWLESRDLAAVYRMADGLLLPSLYESVGMPVMEAMACGCPTLTANRHGTRELYAGATVLVDPESVEDIAAGIVRLLEDRGLRASLRAAGYERSRRFNWRRAAAQVLRVLESLPIAAEERALAADGLGTSQHGGPQPIDTAPSIGVCDDRLNPELLEYTHDAIVIWEMGGGGIQYFNTAAEDLYGYAREEVRGRTTHELFRTELAGGIGLLERHLARFGVWVGELLHTTRDGRRIEVESRIALLLQRNGRSLVIEVNRDISDRKAAEAARSEMERQLAELRDLS
ncbi:MAG TPA: glycosyltransferase [Gammaproteobacteria bacterium]|nr:glycosyltransferase [Gammaproteobacteria bacterium]